MKKTKIIVIEDFENKHHFEIKLFGLIDGLAFAEKVLPFVANILDKDKSIDEIPLIKFVDSLLPLASYKGGNGEMVLIEKCNQDNLSSIFENPFSAIELAKEILMFNWELLGKSKLFQPFQETINKSLHTHNLA